MLLERLFEDVEGCLDEIDLSKQRISDVVSNTNGLCIQHELLHGELKRLRKEVVDGCLVLMQTNSRLSDVSKAIESSEANIYELSTALGNKSKVIIQKKLALESLKNKLKDITSSLHERQVALNKKLLLHYEVEEDAFRREEAYMQLLKRIDVLKRCIRERMETSLKRIDELKLEKDSRTADLSSVRCQIKMAEQERLVWTEELSNLEAKNALLLKNLSNYQDSKTALCREMEQIYDSISLYHKKSDELSNSLKEAQDSINMCNLILSNLEAETKAHMHKKELALATSSELKDALELVSERVEQIEYHRMALSDQESHVKKDVEMLNKSRLQLESRVDAMKTRISGCTTLLQNIRDLATYNENLEKKTSELSKQHSGIMTEIASWNSKNANLTDELGGLRDDVRKADGTKSDLRGGVESETSKFTTISKEIDQLNKEITQARMLLGDLTKQNESEQEERNRKLSELKQRHFDEYKEKQSVKICDIKAELKAQREATLQEKRIKCSRALDECTTKLRSGFADLVNHHQRKLCENNQVIAHLQEELKSLEGKLAD